MKRYFQITLFMMFLLVLSAQHPMYAGVGQDVSYLSRGVAKTTKGVFAIPRNIIQDSTKVVFPIGLVTGTVTGTIKGAFQTVGGVVSGAFDIVRGALPYAKYLALI